MINCDALKKKKPIYSLYYFKLYSELRSPLSQIKETHSIIRFTYTRVGAK